MSGRTTQTQSGSEDWYRKELRDLQSGEYKEAAISTRLVWRSLTDILRWDRNNILPEHGKKFRPDFICKDDNGMAAVIVEVKKLGADLLKRRTDSYDSSPAGQLELYLRNHSMARSGSFGLLTNGTDWLVQKREGEDVFFTPTTKKAETLDEVKAILEPIRQEWDSSKSIVSSTDLPLQESRWLEHLSEEELIPIGFIQKATPSGFSNLQGDNKTYAYVSSVSTSIPPPKILKQSLPA